jgi:hypothetical protein
VGDERLLESKKEPGARIQEARVVDDAFSKTRMGPAIRCDARILNSKQHLKLEDDDWSTISWLLDSGSWLLLAVPF